LVFKPIVAIPEGAMASKATGPKAAIRRLEDGRIRADVSGGRPGAALGMAQTIASLARAAAPVKTGALRRQVTARRTGARSAVVRSDATYSRYQDEGAPRAHVPATHYFTRAVGAANRRR
jgi:Bacteriophage HK97-gp10, putative tail-component